MDIEKKRKKLYYSTGKVFLKRTLTPGLNRPHWGFLWEGPVKKHRETEQQSAM
jgi:hypothetical protein